MRHPRIKFEVGQSGFMHVYNRTGGKRSDLPFGDVEKGELLRRLKELNTFYTVEVLATSAMGNHFHAILYVPAELPDDQETIARYHQRYPEARKLRAGSRKCRRAAEKLRDVSELMKDWQQPFTRWFNRLWGRRGHLWAERYKNTLLEDGLAVWDCWKYIEMNPVRANLSAVPDDYRFCSFGEWCGSGTHPFEQALREHVLPSLKGLLHVQDLEGVKTRLREEFARMKATDEHCTDDETATAIAVAAEKEPFTTRADRRVRYWVDGLVIGSKQYVHEIMLKARGEAALKKRRFTRACDAQGKATALCCFKQLRVLLE